MIPEALAAYRIARLIQRDRILSTPRDAILVWALKPVRGHAAHPKIAELLGCIWCLSIWTAFVVLVVRVMPGGRWLIRALALSAIAGLLAELE